MQYDGHYLVDLGQKDSSNQVQIFEKYKKNATLHDNEYYDNLRRMGGEHYGKGFFLHPTASKDAWVTYAIEPSPYQTMCFAVGAIAADRRIKSAFSMGFFPYFRIIFHLPDLLAHMQHFICMIRKMLLNKPYGT